MNKYARLVDHSEVEWAPILKEGKVDEFALDLEVVVLHGVIYGGSRWVCSIRICGSPTRRAVALAGAVEIGRERQRVGERGEVEPANALVGCRKLRKLQLDTCLQIGRMARSLL